MNINNVILDLTLDHINILKRIANEIISEKLTEDELQVLISYLYTTGYLTTKDGYNF